MSQTIQHASAVITSQDRFGFTLFISIVFNAVVILGIGFTVSDDLPKEFAPPTLEITMVPIKADKEPDEADYFAQTNQLAGGDSEEKSKLETPSPSMITTADSSSSPQMIPQIDPQKAPEHLNKEVLTKKRSDMKIFSEAKEQPEVDKLERVTETQLLTRSAQIAKLSAELSDSLKAYAKKPRQKFLSANTKEYEYASYMDAWKRKIEYIGKLNFPGEAKRKRLSGDLLLDVAINADGTIYEVNVRRSSGYKILDDAAKSIVRAAAPFDSFPEQFSEKIDVLHITRTWQFLSSGTVSTR